MSATATFGPYKASASLKRILDELGDKSPHRTVSRIFHEACDLENNTRSIFDPKFRMLVLRLLHQSIDKHVASKLDECEKKDQIIWSHLRNIISSRFSDALKNAKKENDAKNKLRRKSGKIEPKKTAEFSFIFINALKDLYSAALPFNDQHEKSDCRGIECVDKLCSALHFARIIIKKAR